MKEFLKSKKGITLVALVITIVVLIILAGVIISITLGNGGIIDRAKLAKQEYANAEGYEQKQIAKAANEIDSIVNSDRSVNPEDIKKVIQESCLGFPDYANRTELTSGTEYTANENMYIIIDTYGMGNTLSVGVSLTIGGHTYQFDSAYSGADFGHHSESIIPIKKGDVFTLTFSNCKAYKVSMRY